MGMKVLMALYYFTHSAPHTRLIPESHKVANVQHHTILE